MMPHYAIPHSGTSHVYDSSATKTGQSSWRQRGDELYTIQRLDSHLGGKEEINYIQFKDGKYSESECISLSSLFLSFTQDNCLYFYISKFHKYTIYNN